MRARGPRRRTREGAATGCPSRCTKRASARSRRERGASWQHRLRRAEAHGGLDDVDERRVIAEMASAIVEGELAAFLHEERAALLREVSFGRERVPMTARHRARELD